MTAEERIKNWLSLYGEKDVNELSYETPLDLSNLPITELPALPYNLHILICNNTLLCKLPEDLPPNLRVLICKNTPLKILPQILPSTLICLDISGTQIIHLPIPVPTMILKLICNDFIIMPLNYSIYEYYINSNITAINSIDETSIDYKYKKILDLYKLITII